MTEEPLLGDQLNAQYDHRKLEKMVADGELKLSEYHDAEVITKSACCGADIFGTDDPKGGNGVLLFCTKCKGIL